MSENSIAKQKNFTSPGSQAKLNAKNFTHAICGLALKTQLVGLVEMHEDMIDGAFHEHYLVVAGSNA